MMSLGRKSTLFLAYAYEFEAGGGGEAALRTDHADWKKHTIKGAALLPHLDEYVRKGELLRSYEVAGDLRAAFGGRDAWTLTDGETNVEVVITDPPRLYALDTGYAFVVLGVCPAGTATDELTLAALQDAAYSIGRAGVSQVGGVSPQMKKWLATSHFEDAEPISLRRWLARLVPNLRPDAPRGTPRTTAPALLSVTLAKEPLGREDLHRLRLVHRSDQFVEPAVEPGEEQGVWRVSQREVCMFSSFGFSWVVASNESSQFLSDAPHMIRDRYVYKWLLVEHQRLCLLALATECADMSKGLDGSNFAEMRMRLLEFIAKYNFRHVSNEERHDGFYKRVRDALSIDDLLAEVREEVVEIDTQLAARRAETLNHVLAFLTLVLTPVGIACSIFQTDTIPGKFRLEKLLSASAWGHLFTHGPFLVVLCAASLGAIVYGRVFGGRVVARLLRTLILPRALRDKSQR